MKSRDDFQPIEEPNSMSHNESMDTQ
jgi:hypothetical protein